MVVFACSRSKYINLLYRVLNIVDLLHVLHYQCIYYVACPKGVCKFSPNHGA